jgi:hypothetical protein
MSHQAGEVMYSDTALSTEYHGVSGVTTAPADPKLVPIYVKIRWRLGLRPRPEKHIIVTIQIYLSLYTARRLSRPMYTVYT